VRARGAPIALRIESLTRLSDATRKNRVRVSVDGTILGAFARDDSNAADPITVEVPAELTRRGAFQLRLQLDRCESPLREGTGPDSRPLGILLHAIAFRPAAP
jgi:hypothetical protein